MLSILAAYDGEDVPGDGKLVEALANIVSEEMQRMHPEIEALMVTAAIQTFELDEIQALKNFMDTDTGARAMLKSVTFTQVYVANMGSLINKMTERIGTRIWAELLE